MTSIRLPEKLDDRLTQLAAATKRSKSFYIKEALIQYLDDLEDTYIALERMSDPDRKFYTTEQLLKKLKSKKK